MSDADSSGGAARKRVVGRPFPKGVSGNPGGKKPLPEDIKRARQLNQVELERILNKYLYMDRAEFQEWADKRTGMPVIECLVLQILARGTLEGDERKLEFMLRRLIGPVAEKIEHSGVVRLEDIIAGTNGSDV